MINTLKAINAAVKNNPSEFIRECHDRYFEDIKQIAKRIDDNDDIKIVAIAGPSGSGKTTTAHLLRERLEALGESTAVVSLDDFYLERNNLPILPDGSRDIESVNALDISLIKECFENIIKSGKTFLPRFDFKEGKSIKKDRLLDIGSHGIVIVEGLHAMNPLIADLIPHKNILKIYISVNRSVEDENGIQLLSSRQIRLVRRMLRDDRFRGSTPQQTLHLWNNVIDGEAKHLYCFKNTADILLATFHPYELCVYRERFCKMRQQVTKNTPCYEYFIDTVNAMQRFEVLDEALVPRDALIREFIG